MKLSHFEHSRMAPTRMRQCELTDPVREGDAGDNYLELVADAGLGHVANQIVLVRVGQGREAPVIASSRGYSWLL